MNLVRLKDLLTIAAVSSALLVASAGLATPMPRQDGTAPPRPAAPASGPRTTLDVLTFNAFLRPLLPDRQNERMPLMASELKGYDVLLLQELFSNWHRRKLLKALREDYPFQSRLLGRDRGLGQDGGVIILSKWPIERQFQRLFGEDCANQDCFAEKGVLYARINKQGRPIHLFATHLQSGIDQHALREKQLGTIKALIDQMQLPTDEPVLIGGDLNVDRFAEPRTGAFGKMTRILEAGHPKPPAGSGPHRPTIDPTRNPLADDPSPVYLDYVLYSKAHLRPVGAFNDVRPVAAAAGPLSDHFAVHGHFVFDAASRAPEPGSFAFVEFFKGDDEQEDFVCNVALEDGLDIDLGALPECGGAELRSLRLHDVPAGRVIRFYDRPGSAGASHWTEIVPKRFIASRRFGSFEINLDNSDLRATYSGRDGLDGRVWRIEVSALARAAPVAIN
jgi:endonuclease/exonuclease/phosphatase family metal-dependent hydrolase